MRQPSRAEIINWMDTEIREVLLDYDNHLIHVKTRHDTKESCRPGRTTLREAIIDAMTAENGGRG